jgi:hypothetical protein
MLDVARLLCGDLTTGEVLRHGRNTATMPRELLRFSQDKKPVVVWNTSRRCNLHCIHCYTESKDQEYPNELSHQDYLESDPCCIFQPDAEERPAKGPYAQRVPGW